MSGLNLLPVLIGTFAISQILKDIINIDQRIAQVSVRRRAVVIKLKDFVTHGPNLVRSSLIGIWVGIWVGILPGIGGNIAAMVSYATARSVSKEPRRFGTGEESGVVAAETANNASVGGALIPLITMVRNRRMKLVHFKGADYGQLFDLENDPGEVRNLWDDPACRETREQLLVVLRDWLIESNYTTRDQMAAYR